MYQKGLAVFASVMPIYLRKSRFSYGDFQMPIAYALIMALTVVAYAHFFDFPGDIGWLWLMAGSYGLNVLTVPFVARNLACGKHTYLLAGYAIQLSILILILAMQHPLTLNLLAAAILFRSLVDLLWQWRVPLGRT
jgi:hypothetical protein